MRFWSLVILVLPSACPFTHPSVLLDRRPLQRQSLAHVSLCLSTAKSFWGTMLVSIPISTGSHTPEGSALETAGPCKVKGCFMAYNLCVIRAGCCGILQDTTGYCRQDLWKHFYFSTKATPEAVNSCNKTKKIWKMPNHTGRPAITCPPGKDANNTQLLWFSGV